MAVDSTEHAAAPDAKSKLKRGREEEDQADDDGAGAAKKQKLKGKEQIEDEDEGVDSEEQEEKEKDGGNEGKKPEGPVTVGTMTFYSAVDMFDYFHGFLHKWGTDLNINKFEHTMLLELLKKGHPNPDEKIGGGIQAFQVRRHPRWQSRCYFLIREDGSHDDFSFRKCVDRIFPLPESMKVKLDVNKALGKGRRSSRSKPGGSGHEGSGSGK